MNKHYEKPFIEVAALEKADVLTFSTGDFGDSSGQEGVDRNDGTGYGAWNNGWSGGK